MWNKIDWICLGVSAAAVFGVSVVMLYPTGVTANDPAPVAAAIKVLTLTVEGVSVTASSEKDNNILLVKDSTVFVKPGKLPKLELRAINSTDRPVAFALTVELFTSKVPNLLSRVPMPTAKPTSQWNDNLTINLAPGEVKTFDLSTKVNLKAMSSATLSIRAGNQRVDALTISTWSPPPVAWASPSAPATQPAGRVAVSSLE